MGGVVGHLMSLEVGPSFLLNLPGIFDGSPPSVLAGPSVAAYP